MVLRELGETTAELDILKNRSHRIVVLNRKRIELVVVAACATDGDTD